MAPTLRGRLVCFYCGSRSAQSRRRDLSSWQCEKCEAVNHLDENGEITDPPACGDYTNARYAHSIPRPSSPIIDNPDQTLFCQTCLKNQHVFAETLAAYFPSQDAPNYADFEKAYPIYRKDLEERYPQVCEKCAPRVQERIRATGYAAKTDHLRRMMERTRGHGVVREDTNWKGMLAFVGGTAWFISLAGQVAWDGLVLLMSGQHDEGLVDEDISVSACIQQVMRGSHLAPGCTILAPPTARLALLLGVLGCWWNPKLQEISRRRGGRLTGVSEYYKQQALLLLVRFLAYLYLDRIPDSDINTQKTLGIHAFLLFFCLLMTIMSFRAIGIDYAPRVVFQDSPEPLVSQQGQYGVNSSVSISSIRPVHELERPTPHSPSINPNFRSFSINDFAPTSRQQHSNPYQPPYQPPTPPPDDNDDDDEAMDWTPSQQPALRPAVAYRPISSAIQQPQQNPFRGHLPADIVSQEHRLRNPPIKPVFRKASEVPKQNFFTTPRRNSRYTDDASEAGTLLEPSSSNYPSPAGPRFADPKLHIQSDQTPVTGLERLLASTFSLSDEPPQIRTAGRQEAQAYQEGRRLISEDIERWHRLPVLFLLTASNFFWSNSTNPSLKAYDVQTRLATLVLAATLSLRSVLLTFRKDMVTWSASDVLVFTAEFAVSVVLTVTIGDASDITSQTAAHRTQETIGRTLIIILTLQELWIFSQEVWTAMRYSQTEIDRPSASKTARSPRSLDPNELSSAPNKEDTASRRTTSAVVRAGASQPRSRTDLGHPASPGTGLGSLSLGGNVQHAQLKSADAFSPEKTRRRHRDGMW